MPSGTVCETCLSTEEANSMTLTKMMGVQVLAAVIAGGGWRSARIVLAFCKEWCSHCVCIVCVSVVVKW